jgi:hypothetical protein
MRRGGFQPHRHDGRSNHHGRITCQDFCAGCTIVLEDIHHLIQAPWNRENDTNIEKNIVNQLNENKDSDEPERIPADGGSKEPSIDISGDRKAHGNNENICKHSIQIKSIIPNIQILAKKGWEMAGQENNYNIND